MPVGGIPLLIVAAGDKGEMIDFLIQAGANMKVTDMYNQNLVSFATENQNLKPPQTGH